MDHVVSLFEFMGLSQERQEDKKNRASPREHLGVTEEEKHRRKMDGLKE